MRNALNFIAYGNALHTFSHFLSRARIHIKSWKASGLNQLESTIIETEQAISDIKSANNSHSTDHTQLTTLYAKLGALQQQNAIK